LKQLLLIGYSGHSFVVNDIFLSQNIKVEFYCDAIEKPHNPLNLNYLGDYTNAFIKGFFQDKDYFISIGNNAIRRKIQLELSEKNHFPVNAIHNSVILSNLAIIGQGVMLSMGSIINAFAKIGDGAIINTNATIEHECQIGDFVHIAPGAVLCGNVSVGEMSFIGANSVVKQGISIGKNVTIGAGSVIINDIPDNTTWIGNPAKKLEK
jgi:sugar O-acyltransferase (sialic acid O-acetyltransferase NeuD family)